MFNRRLRRIFRDDGRAVIVAFDHGLIDGPIPGLEHPAATLGEIVAGGADAVLTSYGVATRFADALAPVGLIVRLDGGGTKLGTAGPAAQFYTVEDALRLGVDAVVVSAFPGTAQERETLKMLARVIAEAHAWGLPVLAELQPGGFDAGPAFFTVENISLSARVAAELGADMVKVPYAPGFERVVSACYVPVVVLGGARHDQPGVLLENIAAAMQCGAAGVAIGRNVFQAEHPRRMAAAIAAITHRSASVDDALAILNGA